VTEPAADAANPSEPPKLDEHALGFLTHLGLEKGASEYTVRNYQQALVEFTAWHRRERKAHPKWTALERDDFRAYLRFLGRERFARAAIRLRFSALRSFYKFLVRRGVLATTPNGPDLLNAPFTNGMTLLQNAVTRGDLEAVRYLVQRGAAINGDPQGGAGPTPSCRRRSGVRGRVRRAVEASPKSVTLSDALKQVQSFRNPPSLLRT
jgi:hypothetical protein